MAEPKSTGAFRTIGEVSADLGLPQHILRYWETRFPQLRPLTRAGNRRYYRPEDIALVRRIDQALNQDGYTIKGAQALLRGGSAPMASLLTAARPGATAPKILPELIRIRDSLKAALTE